MISASDIVKQIEKGEASLNLLVSSISVVTMSGKKLVGWDVLRRCWDWYGEEWFENDRKKYAFEMTPLQHFQAQSDILKRWKQDIFNVQMDANISGFGSIFDKEPEPLKAEEIEKKIESGEINKSNLVQAINDCWTALTAEDSDAASEARLRINSIVNLPSKEQQ